MSGSLPDSHMLLRKLAFGSNMHPHSLARYKFITKMLLYVYMQRIRPEGSRHEVGGGGQPGGGNAEHWVVHKMLFRWYINKDWM